jgi:hypothetical protein
MADATSNLVSPRLAKRYQRYARFTRINHSKQQLSFLKAQATRLGTTVAKVFAAHDSYTAEQVRKATSKSQLGIA